MITAELIKLRRSSVWIIAVILPLLAVTTGTVNYSANTDVLAGGWMSYWSQVVLFYGLLFLAIGIALLASTIWRTEHQGTNWNLLLTTPRKPLTLALAKITAIALPVAFMQIVLVSAAYATGNLILDIEGPFPAQFALAASLGIIGALPAVAAQSLLSTVLKSFAAPVGIALAGCAVGIAAVTSPSLTTLGHLIPQAIITRTMNLGSTAIEGSGGLDSASIAPILASSLALTAALTILGALAIDRQKTH